MNLGLGLNIATSKLFGGLIAPGDISAPTAGYSLRNLSVNYFGQPVIRVREDDGNTEQDFTSNQITDGTLASFVGANNGFVVTWYDQFGSHHARQTSASNQPKIYDSVDGVLKYLGIPAIYFDGTSTYFEIISDITGEDFSVFTSFTVNSQDPATDGYIFDNLTSYGRALYHDDYLSGAITLQSDTTSTSPIRVRSSVDTDLSIVSAIIDNNPIVGGSVSIYRNGVLEDSFSGDVPYQENTFTQYIGAGSATPANVLDGQIHELIIYTNKTINEPFRLSVENSISFYVSNPTPEVPEPYAPIDGNEFEWNGFTYRVVVRDYGGGNKLAWLDRNLGATQVATSSTDSQAYGDLYQWGRLTDGHEKRNSGTTLTLSTTDVPGNDDFIRINASPFDWRDPQNNNLWQGVDGINNPAPPGWRIPTEADWNAEIGSWSSTDSSGAFNSPLKLPVAGYRSNGSGSIFNADSTGYYWSSEVDGTNAKFLFFFSSDAYMNIYYRSLGNSVRCVRDIP